MKIVTIFWQPSDLYDLIPPSIARTLEESHPDGSKKVPRPTKGREPSSDRYQIKSQCLQCEASTCDQSGSDLNASSNARQDSKALVDSGNHPMS